ncbi:MAG: Hsp20/alpha crystallin family protein [Planctomycetota bacterium]
MFHNDWFGRFPMLHSLAERDRLFERLFREHAHAVPRAYPPLNVHEDPEKIVVLAELPGVDPESLDVKVQNDTLLIQGSRVADEEGGQWIRRERLQGDFRRVISLPSKVANQEVEAEYRLGILSVTMPKAPEAKPHVIKVKTA